MTESNNEEIPGDYIAGFVDGEGCFALVFRKDKQRNQNGYIREYFYWSAVFVIVLRKDDVGILHKIKKALACGTLSGSTKYDFVRFSVQNPKDLFEKVIPFFERYKLRGKKRRDFDLWKQAVNILYRYRDGFSNSQKGVKGFIKKPLLGSDNKILEYLRNKMLEYKSKRASSFKWGSTI